MVFLLSPSLGMKDSLGPLKALVVASSVNAIGHVVLCNMLHYGIIGAAWATMTSQVCSMNTKQLIYMVLCISHFLLVANSSFTQYIEYNLLLDLPLINMIYSSLLQLI